MKINIGYYTSTGNTIWLAHKAKENFERNGHEVELFDVVTSGETFIENCDMVGIFYPVWGSSLPTPLKDVVNNIAPINGTKKMFLIGNCGILVDDTGLHWKKKIRKKGFDVFYADILKMPVNSCIPGLSFFKPPDEENKAQILAEAQQKLHQICTEISESKSKIRGRGPLARFIGILQRGFFSYSLSKWAKSFTVCETRCTKCRLCLQICPTGNIHFDGNDMISFGSDCIFCLKCYNLCRKNAILFGEESIDDEKFVRYKGPDISIKPIRYRD